MTDVLKCHFPFAIASAVIEVESNFFLVFNSIIQSRKTVLKAVTAVFLVKKIQCNAVARQFDTVKLHDT